MAGLEEGRRALHPGGSARDFAAGHRDSRRRAPAAVRGGGPRRGAGDFRAAGSAEPDRSAAAPRRRSAAPRRASGLRAAAGHADRTARGRRRAHRRAVARLPRQSQRARAGGAVYRRTARFFGAGTCGGAPALAARAASRARRDAPRARRDAPRRGRGRRRGGRARGGARQPRAGARGRPRRGRVGSEGGRRRTRARAAAACVAGNRSDSGRGRPYPSGAGRWPAVLRLRGDRAPPDRNRDVDAAHRGAVLSRSAALGAAPGQTGVSLAAIVAAMSLMVSMAIMVTSFRQSLDEWLERVLPADLYLRTGAGSDTAFLSPAEQRVIAALPGVRRVEFLRSQRLFVAPDKPPITLLARAVEAEG